MKPTIMTDLILRDVTVCHGANPVVHHVDATLHFGDFIALVGPNGAGKSTLLRAMLGWHALTTGAITINGKSLAECAGRISYLPQRRELDLDFPATVGDVVAMGRYGQLGSWREFTVEDHRAVDQAIHEMGLERLRERSLSSLSGGQAQRAFLARALASGADVFLLDEPFAGLDPTAVAALARALRQWATRGRLIVAVVHDLILARSVFTRALVLRTHLLADDIPERALSDANIALAFGVRALTAPMTVPTTQKASP